MPVLLTKPCRPVLRIRKCLTAVIMLIRFIRFIYRRLILAKECIFLILVIAAVLFYKNRAYI
jgi:hypothetical protein